MGQTVKTRSASLLTVIVVMAGVSICGSRLFASPGDLPDDPRTDGWSTEASQQAAQSQLERLGVAISSELIAPNFADGLVADDFVSTPLRPSDLRSVYADGTISVLRSATSVPPVNHLRGVDGLKQALRGLGGNGTKGLRAKFKIFRNEIFNEINVLL